MPRSANCGRLMPPGAAFCPVFGGAFTVRFVIFSASSKTSNNTSAGGAAPPVGALSRASSGASLRWGKNLSDELYADSRYGFLGSAWAHHAAPRTYGVSIQWNLGQRHPAAPFGLARVQRRPHR